MKFVDEAYIKVIAGNGGNGCLSFRREKYVPRGGPDGGNGGNGGNIYVISNRNINTLVDFRYKRTFKATCGQDGTGRQKTGSDGDDLYIQAPVGTMVFDADTKELIGDLVKQKQSILVAKGGKRGLGNINFKSSTNRAPRKSTNGTSGEERTLHLELKVLADVGLLGMPNAGKSTFIRAVSAARPKVADYPFTTLHPNLGVVSIEEQRSFVIADIPGLIEGASEGAGLGVRFLKHLSRTGILLHMIDIAPIDGSNPVDTAQTVIHELKHYDKELANKERWIVLNKIDQLTDTQIERRSKEILKKLKWNGPVFKISALTKRGTRKLCYQLMDKINL